LRDKVFPGVILNEVKDPCEVRAACVARSFSTSNVRITRMQNHGKTPRTKSLVAEKPEAVQQIESALGSFTSFKNKIKNDKSNAKSTTPP